MEQVPNETVVVKYWTKKHYCSCCGQKLPEIEVSEEMEFEFDKKLAMDWANWNDIAEFQEDLDSLVPDFIYEAIKFFVLDSSERIVIADSEVEKVKEFILRVVVNSKSEEFEVQG